MKQTRTTHTFLFISHTTNVLLYKFSCNISIGVGFIKEMPCSVASGTHCRKYRGKNLIRYVKNKFFAQIFWKRIIIRRHLNGDLL